MAKTIIYTAPVYVMAGSISGRQALTYGAEQTKAYETEGATAANNYKPNLVLQWRRKSDRRFFSVRTKYTTHMTVKNRTNLAELGGAGAIYSAIVRDKSGSIYQQCVNALPPRVTLRKFLIPIIRAGLSGKMENITIADGVVINNPWISSAAGPIQVPADVLDKFATILSNQ